MTQFVKWRVTFVVIGTFEFLSLELFSDRPLMCKLIHNDGTMLAVHGPPRSKLPRQADVSACTRASWMHRVDGRLKNVSQLGLILAKVNIETMIIRKK